MLNSGKALNREVWDDVELTDEEVADALSVARKQKYYREEERERIAQYNKQVSMLLGTWDVSLAANYAFTRARTKFGFSDARPYELDEHSRPVFKALSMYFVDDAGFEQLDESYSLDKGILLCGGVGCGKTQIMKLFAINKKANYDVLNCMDMANRFVQMGNTKDSFDMMDRYSMIHRTELKSLWNLEQEAVGICFDDMGTEAERQIYGNRTNVIAELIQRRYGNRNGLPFHYTHITTNLGAMELEKQYGPRVWDRIKEMFNIIPMTGGSRRKLTK